MSKHTGKVAVVIAASEGIGDAIAKSLAAEVVSVITAADDRAVYDSY